MEKIFHIDEVKKYLGLLHHEQITFSKFVEILNVKANDKYSVNWMVALTDKPEEGETVICQFKDFKCGEVTYFEAAKEVFEETVDCWLWQPYVKNNLQ